MKKNLLFVVLITTMGFCSEDIKVKNSTVLPGVKNNLFWKGSNVKSAGAGDTLTIPAGTLFKTVTLKPETLVDPKNESTVVTDVLGTTTTRKATCVYKNDMGEIFNYETAISVGDRQVVIADYDGNCVLGTFRFNAENTNSNTKVTAMVNLQNGVFVRIPLAAVP